MRHDRRAVPALAALALLVAASTLGPLAYPVDPDALDLARTLALPSRQHPLGTDESGRDVLARLLAGGRVTLTVGGAAMLVAAAAGTLVGAVAALAPRAVDTVLMRGTDAALAIPPFFVILATLTTLGPATPTLVLAIGATSWMTLARLVRGELLALRQQGFVEAAIALGQPARHRFARHLLPHLWPTILVNATVGTGSAMLTESALSFLGLGVQPPAASWGNMLASAQASLYVAPRLALVPGVLIVATVLAVSALGQALLHRFPSRA